jgi:hypothetical protein
LTTIAADTPLDAVLFAVVDVETTGGVDPSALVALGQVVLVLIGRHAAKMGAGLPTAKVASGDGEVIRALFARKRTFASSPKGHSAP